MKYFSKLMRFELLVILFAVAMFAAMSTSYGQGRTAWKTVTSSNVIASLYTDSAPLVLNARTGTGNRHTLIVSNPTSQRIGIRLDAAYATNDNAHVVVPALGTVPIELGEAYNGAVSARCVSTNAAQTGILFFEAGD